MSEIGIKSASAAPQLPCLALRAAEAAKALGISERLLWSKTNAGEVPCIRIGRAVVYPVDCLREWLVQEAEGGRG